MAGKIVPELYCSRLDFNRLTVYLACTRKGAFRIGLALEGRQGCLDFFREYFPGALLLTDKRLTRPLARRVKSAFFNSAPKGKLHIDKVFTSFEEKVLKTIARIPFGQTRTYGEIARRVGKPGGARAVGQVMRKNAFPLIFP